MFKTESLTVPKHEQGLRILVSVSLVQNRQLVLTETITFLLSGNTKVTVSDTIANTDTALGNTAALPRLPQQTMIWY